MADVRVGETGRAEAQTHGRWRIARIHDDEFGAAATDVDDERPLDDGLPSMTPITVR